MKSKFATSKFYSFSKLILSLMISVILGDCNSQGFVKDEYSATKKNDGRITDHSKGN